MSVPLSRLGKRRLEEEEGARVPHAVSPSAVVLPCRPAVEAHPRVENVYLFGSHPAPASRELLSRATTPHFPPRSSSCTRRGSRSCASAPFSHSLLDNVTPEKERQNSLSSLQPSRRPGPSDVRALSTRRPVPAAASRAPSCATGSRRTGTCRTSNGRRVSSARRKRPESRGRGRSGNALLVDVSAGGQDGRGEGEKISTGYSSWRI